MTKERIKKFIEEFDEIEKVMIEELKDVLGAGPLLISLLCEEVSIDEFWEDYEDLKKNAPEQDLCVHF